MDVITDEKKIEKVLARSVDTVYPNKDQLKKRMMNGDKLRVYAGIDPTAKRVHLGHAINYLILKRFRELGHKTIVLIGDFTARIGDPSDKTSARKKLSEDEIKENLKNFKDQIGKIINLEAKDNPVEFRFNSEWLSELDLSNLIEIASNFTVQQMIERDVFRRRLKEEKPLYVHEFFYPLMQGYDTVALEADVEVGGTDQMFNMLAGRTLRERLAREEKFVITHPLLADPDSNEMLMSKSEGKGIFLDSSANEMFARVMRIPDNGIIQFFIHCTEKPLSEIKQLEKKLADDTVNPRDIKLELAQEITTLFCDKEAAQKAKESFIDTFSKQKTPDDSEEISVKEGDRLMDILTDAGVVSSNSQFRRLVDQGAVLNTETDKKITDHTHEVNQTATFKIGKHRFVKLIIE